MARAASEAGLKHVIWSTLEDTRKWVSLDDWLKVNASKIPLE